MTLIASNGDFISGVSMFFAQHLTVGAPHMLQMMLVMAIILVAVILFMIDRIAIEFTAMMILISLMLLFHFAPIDAASIEAGSIEAGNASMGSGGMRASDVLLGFANPALITVLCLLVLGDGLDKTGVLDQLATTLCDLSKGQFFLILGFTLFLVMLFSAFLNNTPLVVIMIPVMRTMALRAKHAPSAFMMPLSYVAILGGMTTLIGSSTNLLVSAELEQAGYPAIGFFDFFVMGGIIAIIGFVYVVVVLPRFLPNLSPTAVEESNEGGGLFLAQFLVTNTSPFKDAEPIGGAFPLLANISVKSIQRGKDVLHPPFDHGIRLNDFLVVVGKRNEIMKLIGHDFKRVTTDLVHQPTRQEDEVSAIWIEDRKTTAEIIIPPYSPLIGKTVKEVDFRKNHHSLVLGVQLKQKQSDARLLDIPLGEGDSLLIRGKRLDIEQFRNSQDIVLLEWTQTNAVVTKQALIAGAIFGVTILLMTSGFVPIVTAALIGALAMVAFRILPIIDAARALDYKVMLVISSALAMGLGLQQTGGANFIASHLYGGLHDLSPTLMLSLMFLIIAIITNFLSNNATAVLFTPIAISLAESVGAPVMPFVISVLIASNCSFASPVGYQTNILVMEPGGYRFVDYIKAGVPLILICWVSFSVLAYLIWDL